MSSRGRIPAARHASPAVAAGSLGGRRSHKGLPPSLRAARPAVLLLVKSLLVPLASAAPLTSLWPHILEDDAEPPKSPSDPGLWIYLSVAVFLVLLGGVFAGLTIALMGQDETYLQVIATSGEGSERKHAEKVLGLLKRGKHWVLVTLLLGNVITNETLPIVLDRSLGGGWPAVLSSTVLIVIFGEIAPQSVCVRYGLSIGSFMTPFVYILMWIMFPVAWPTAKLLDWLLGEDHGTTYKKAGLKTLVSLHKTLGSTPGERLMEDEVNIINSVLDLKEKPVGDILTPMQDVFIMSADTVLDERMMDTILSQGYSRIPIYAPDNNRNFIGMLLVKILITYDPEDCKRVRDFSLATLPETAPHTSCLDIINFFQEGKSHMVLVSEYPGQDKGALGVVTLEDVIEELIGEEIIDESDVFVDVHKAIRRMQPAPKQHIFRNASMDHIATDESEQESGKEQHREDEPLLGKTSSRKTSLTNGGPPAATFLMRRKSSNASSVGERPPGVTAVRSNTVDMREHLKHLGPSNAANRPRATKYTSVKIKPGVGTIPENRATTRGVNGDGEPLLRSQSVDIPQDTEETRRLRSAGRDASNGAAALRAGYGTMSPEGTPRKRGLSADAAMSPREASQMAEQKANVGPPPGFHENPRVDDPQKTVVGPGGEEMEADDNVGEMNNDFGSTDRSKSRRQARSGSITETLVDIGGMKKVVLETTSSSSDDGDAEAEAESGGGSQTLRKKGSGSSKGSTGRKKS